MLTKMRKKHKFRVMLGKIAVWLDDFCYNKEWTWYLWRRWRIYCPTYPINHLFEKKSIGLFDYDEEFISPCCLNEINCGGNINNGKYRNKIQFIELSKGLDD